MSKSVEVQTSPAIVELTDLADQINNFHLRLYYRKNDGGWSLTYNQHEETIVKESLEELVEWVKEEFMSCSPKYKNAKTHNVYKPRTQSYRFK